MNNDYRCLKEVAVILPSLDPDHRFASVVQGLVEAGFENIIMVDDGSHEENRHFFAEAEKNPQCTLLVHEVNKGKGRALKDAMNYVAENLPSLSGVVTIDGDGQHLLPDIIACAEKMLECGDKVIMGCRDFSQPGVPPRSVAGNRTTSAMFRIFFNVRISDTQTGLRAVPAKYLRMFGAFEGERFEYETNMLLQMKRHRIPFVEQSIATVYDEQEYSSHYNAVKDSWRIFKIMFRFMVSK